LTCGLLNSVILVILTFKVSQMAELGYFVSQMADFEGQDHKNHKIGYNLAHLLKFFPAHSMV